MENKWVKYLIGGRGGGRRKEIRSRSDIHVYIYDTIEIFRNDKNKLVKESLIHRRIESCDQARWWTSVRWGNGEKRKKKKRMPRLQPYYSTTNALIFFFFSLSHLFFFFFSHVISFILYHTNLLLRYAYLSNEHRTKSEIKIKIILFAIMISSFDYVCLLTSITFHFFSAQYSHSSSSIVSRSMNRKREKNL